MAEIKVLNRKEVMKKLNISYTTLWRLEKEGKLNPFKYFDKGRVFYVESEVDEFLTESASKLIPTT